MEHWNNERAKGSVISRFFSINFTITGAKNILDPGVGYIKQGVEGGSWLLIPHSHFFITTNPPDPELLSSLSRVASSFPIPIPCQDFGESRFLRSSKIPYPVKTPHLELLSSLPLIPFSFPIKYPVPRSRFGSSRKIPYRVKTFFVFPNPAFYMSQMPGVGNSLPDPDRRLLFQSSTINVKKRKDYIYLTYVLTYYTPDL